MKFYIRDRVIQSFIMGREGGLINSLPLKVEGGRLITEGGGSIDDLCTHCREELMSTEKKRNVCCRLTWITAAFFE